MENYCAICELEEETIKLGIASKNKDLIGILYIMTIHMAIPKFMEQAERLTISISSFGTSSYEHSTTQLTKKPKETKRHYKQSSTQLT